MTLRTPVEQLLLDNLNGTNIKDKVAFLEALFRILTQNPPCSFRRLIYERLDLPQSAYTPLYEAGGMHITSALSDYLDSPWLSHGEQF